MIKIDEQTVTWTIQFYHAAKIEVYRDNFMPFLHSRITANGSLSATIPLSVGAFSVGAITAGAYPDVSWPHTDQLPFDYTLTYPSGQPAPAEWATMSIRFGLPEGVHTQPHAGSLTFRAPCDVMADMLTMGEGDGAGFVGFHHRGFQRDTPDRTKCRLWLRLRELATWTLVTNIGTYTGTCGSVGADLPNELHASATVTAIAGTQTAEGRVNIICSNGSYRCDGASPTWSYSGGTCSGELGDGHLVGRATPTSGGASMTTAMAGGWHLSREASITCAVLNPSGGGIPSELAVSRHGNDTALPIVTATDGYYEEGITQRMWFWSFNASSGTGSFSDGGTWSNWGDLSVGLNPVWSLANEYHDLPEDWSDYLPYRTWQDNRMLMHLWAVDGPTLSHAAMSSLGLGWAEGGYTLASGAWVSGGALTCGRWTVIHGSLDPDGLVARITPDTGTVAMTLRRTLEWDTEQLGENPSRPPRPTFAGYRYLRICLRRDRTPQPLDTVTVRIKQDNLAALYPDPTTMTWENPSLAVKTWTTKVKADGTIEIDLARPDITGLVSEGGNPPPTGNHGELARPNTLSRWPQPVLDGTLSGVTLPEWLEVEVPTTDGDDWILGSVELFRKSEPLVWLLPPLNQWIREERYDLLNEEDTTQRKHWRRRLLLGVCDGLPNLEGFDIVRTSSHLVSEELGEFDIFAWELKSVAGVAVQVVEEHEFNLWQFGVPDVPVGVLRRWPGWSVSIPTPAAGSVYEWVLAGSGCRWGGHGVIWTASPQVQSCLGLGGTKVQSLVDAIDWFAGVHDPFNLGDDDLVLRVATVLHGSAIGAGLANDTVELKAGETLVQSVATGTNGALLAMNPGGKHYLDHSLLRDGQELVSWTGEGCSWDFRPSLTASQVYPCLEAPLWWHSRGLHVAHWAKWFGPLVLRRNKQGKLLCQKRSLPGGGRCVRCRQG